VSDDDEERVVVRCSRCADIPTTSVPSEKRRCSECGANVWLAQSTIDMIAKRYRAATLTVVCIGCRAAEDIYELISLPEQVEVLRESGDSDLVIAYKLAIAEIAGGAGSLEEAEAEILAFPGGLRAKAFPAAMNKAVLLVASTRRSN
jgi:hypothetical protein